MTGPAQEVVSAYLNRCRNAHIEDAGAKLVTISNVTMRDEHGECHRFQSGQKAWIDVELRARKRCTKLSVSLYITDDEHQNVFDTSTERLGLGNFTLDEGDVYACTFELSLNMPNGIFHPAILVYRYDTQTEYDSLDPATTIYVGCEEDVRGTVHCFPRVIRHEIHLASEANLAAAARDASDGGKDGPG